MNLTILHSNNYSPNECHFLYPLLAFRRALKHDFNIHLHFSKTRSIPDTDILIVTSKWFTDYWGRGGIESIVNELEYLRIRAEKIIWFDLSDSTGTTQFMVLPYVDLYLKNQVFSDRTLYLNSYYGSRIYADFIHKTFGVNDNNPGPLHLNYIPDKSLLEKVHCGWNSGIAYLGKYRHLQNYLLSKNHRTLSLFKNTWRLPSEERRQAVTCRIGTQYNRDTISYSRRLIKEKLQRYISVGKISHRHYIKELAHSRSAIAPFGLGEISLRDFELVINGVAMIKQDMSLIETWPNLWIQNETYLDFQWDCSDLQEKVAFAVQHPKKMQMYAEEAQSIYSAYLDAPESAYIFCQRLNGFLESLC